MKFLFIPAYGAIVLVPMGIKEIFLEKTILIFYRFLMTSKDELGIGVSLCNRIHILSNFLLALLANPKGIQQ